VVDQHILNLMAQGCAMFNQKQRMADVMLQASVLDYRINMQAYFKCQLNTLYAEEELEENHFEQTNALLYYYILFANDCPTDEDFKFGRSFIEEYLLHNMSESLEHVKQQGFEHITPEYIEAKQKARKRGQTYKNWEVYYTPEESIGRDESKRNKVFP
jgi:hypothetical protein